MAAAVDEPGPDLTQARPTIAAELEPIPSMLGLQGIAADEETGDWYMHQAVRDGMPGFTGGDTEDTRIHRFGAAAAAADGLRRAPYVATTEWPHAGHNSDVDTHRDGPSLRLWGCWIVPGADGRPTYRIVRMPWKVGRCRPEDGEAVNVWEKPTKAQYPIVDGQHDLLIVRTNSGPDQQMFTRRRISDVLAGRNTVLGRMLLPDPPVYQGSASYGRHLYRATAHSIDGGPQYVEQYDWRTGDKVAEVEVGRHALLPTETGTDWLEIEGLTVTSRRLYAGIKVHNGKRRRFRILDVAPTPAFADEVGRLRWPLVRLGRES